MQCYQRAQKWPNDARQSVELDRHCAQTGCASVKRRLFAGDQSGDSSGDEEARKLRRRKMGIEL